MSPKIIQQKEHATLATLRYVGGLGLSVLLMAVPRALLQNWTARLLRRRYFRNASEVLFYKSGRSALAAVFERIAATHPGAIVLLPDYLCNVVHRAAEGLAIDLQEYRTDERFQADLEDLERRLRAKRACAIVLASIFGARNRKPATLKKLRAIDRELLLILDDCQNLVSSDPCDLDDRSIAVFSFNDKNIPGMMGGGLCAGAGGMGLRQPPRRLRDDLALEIRLLALQARQSWRRVLRTCRALIGGRPICPPPEIEFSDCRLPQYDTRIRRIAKWSLVRGLLGLIRLPALERQRRCHYAAVRAIFDREGLGEVIATEQVEVAPFIPVQRVDASLIGVIPWKGPYATCGNRGVSLRPDVMAVRNDGFCPVEYLVTVSESSAVASPRLEPEPNSLQPHPIRVCHLTSAHRATDNRLFDKEAASLARAQYEVLLIGPHDKAETKYGVSIVPVPEPSGRLGRLRLALLRIPQMAIKAKADVYHFHDPELIFLGLVLKLLGKRVIYDVHEDYEQTILSAEWLPRWMRRVLCVFWGGIERTAGRIFDGIVVVDSNIRRKFPPGRTEMVTNVPPLFFLETEPKPEPDGVFRIVHIGVISEEHSATPILEALDRLGDRKVELHLVGTVYSEELQRRLEAHPKVVWHGRMPWLKSRRVVERADVGLLLYQPSPVHLLFTGEGNTKLFEYMSVGLPVVISHFPRLTALIESLDVGVAVDPTSPNEIARVLVKLAENPAARQRMGQNGRNAVRERYNWECEEKKLLAMYERVLAKLKQKRACAAAFEP